MICNNKRTHVKMKRFSDLGSNECNVLRCDLRKRRTNECNVGLKGGGERGVRRRYWAIIIAAKIYLPVLVLIMTH